MTSTKSVVLFALFFIVAGVSARPARAQAFKVLYAFAGGSDGGVPSAGLTLDQSGNLYGETFSGGDAGCFADCGVVFELTPGSGGWTESVLHSFTGGSDGGNPIDTLILDKAGNLYGTADVGGISCGHTYGCGVAFELSPGSDGWTETVLYSFQGGTGGYYPVAGFALDRNGNLYSTMPNGGGREEAGVVYELSSADGWNEQILYSFGGDNPGTEPNAAPILDAKGNLYGTTPLPAGAVWELMRPTWKERTLYEFQSGGGDNPEGSLIFDKAGNLYGTTSEGGGKNQSGKGVVFKLTKSKSGDWKETVLHVFRGGTDGSTLYSTLVFDKAGNLYGTTSWGGNPSCNPPYGCGTVFKLAPGKNGRWKETILHRFGGSDGRAPYAGVAIDAKGNLYGTTELGGNPGCYANAGCGVVFEITP